MSVQFEYWGRSDLAYPLRIDNMAGVMFTQDNMANRIGVEVFDSNAPVTLTGDISCNIIRPDGNTVPISHGSKSGNKAWIDLPEAAYAYVGTIRIVIKHTAGNEETTIFCGEGYVNASETGQPVDPGTVVTDFVTDVKVNNQSVLQNRIANIPIANGTTPGVMIVRSWSDGVYIDTNNRLSIAQATTAQIKDGANNARVITPASSNVAAFYGLAKAAGDTTQAQSDNPVGTYTDGAKTAIRTMLGVGGAIDVQVNGTSILSNNVANITPATTDAYGVVKVGNGLTIDSSSNKLKVAGAADAHAKEGTSTNVVITPNREHSAAFYGLAKAAGDSTMASSSNAIGVYTEAAKSAISEMLNGSVSVSGTTPSITAKAGIRYVCGECATLSITVPETGIIDVMFESGSTATVLTVTPPTGSTMKWANGFDPTTLEANTTYEINIMDGVFGVVCTWT